MGRHSMDYRADSVPDHRADPVTDDGAAGQVGHRSDDRVDRHADASIAPPGEPMEPGIPGTPGAPEAPSAPDTPVFPGTEPFPGGDPEPTAPDPASPEVAPSEPPPFAPDEQGLETPAPAWHATGEQVL